MIFQGDNVSSEDQKRELAYKLLHSGVIRENLSASSKKWTQKISLWLYFKTDKKV